jgi:hypothetical protein
MLGTRAPDNSTDHATQLCETAVDGLLELTTSFVLQFPYE